MARKDTGRLLTTNLDTIVVLTDPPYRFHTPLAHSLKHNGMCLAQVYHLKIDVRISNLFQRLIRMKLTKTSICDLGTRRGRTSLYDPKLSGFQKKPPGQHMIAQNELSPMKPDRGPHSPTASMSPGSHIRDIPVALRQPTEREDSQRACHSLDLESNTYKPSRWHPPIETAILTSSIHRHLS